MSTPINLNKNLTTSPRAENTNNQQKKHEVLRIASKTLAGNHSPTDITRHPSLTEKTVTLSNTSAVQAVIQQISALDENLSDSAMKAEVQKLAAPLVEKAV